MWSAQPNEHQPKSNTWPDPLEFGPMPPSVNIPQHNPHHGHVVQPHHQPIINDLDQSTSFNQLGINVPIGAEIKKNNGSSSPFDLSVSEDSDSNTRWEPAALWDGKFSFININYKKLIRIKTTAQ